MLHWNRFVPFEDDSVNESTFYSLGMQEVRGGLRTFHDSSADAVGEEIHITFPFSPWCMGQVSDKEKFLTKDCLK